MIFHMLLIFLLLQFFTIEGLKNWKNGPCYFINDPSWRITDVDCFGQNISESGTVARIAKLMPTTLTNNTLHIKFNDFTIRILENECFIQYNNLTELSFYINSLETIEPHAFRNLNKLEILSINSNIISSLPDGVFHDLQHIREIYLNNNNIIYLQKKLFSNLLNLFYIDLSNNFIQKIDDWCFLNLPALKTINLSNNNLTNISPDITDNLNSITFELNKNPWPCNAKLCPVLDSFNTTDSPICETPMKIYITWKAVVEIISQNISNRQDKKQFRLRCEEFLMDTEPIDPECKINSIFLGMLIIVPITAIIIIIFVLWLRVQEIHDTHEQHKITSLSFLSGEDPVPFPPPKRGNGMPVYIASNRTNGNNFTQTSTNQSGDSGMQNKRNARNGETTKTQTSTNQTPNDNQTSGNNEINSRTTNVNKSRQDDNRENSERLGSNRETVEMINLPRAIEE